MTQPNAITIPRRRYTGLWVAIVILVLIVIVCLLKSGNRVKTSAFDDVIAGAEAPIVVVVGADLVPHFFSPDDTNDRTLRALDSCGKLGGNGTEIPPGCPIPGPVNRFSSITFLEYGSGSCVAGVDSLGIAYTKHTSGQYLNKKPCHNPHN